MARLLLKTIDPTGMVRHGRARDSIERGSTACGSFIHHSHYVGSTLIKGYRNCRNEGEIYALKCCRLLLCSHNFLKQFGRA